MQMEILFNAVIYIDWARKKDSVADSNSKMPSKDSSMHTCEGFVPHSIMSMGVPIKCILSAYTVSRLFIIL